MPFHLSNSSPTKYSSIEYQKLHEYEYKKFLKTLQINNHSINLTEQNLLKHQQRYSNNNYLFQRQINLQYRQDKRKHEYERIQKENFKFSQRLINAKPFLNRYEQQIFFDKHCQLKQRLQHYPDFISNQTKKSDWKFSSNNHLKIIKKPVDVSFLIYNDKPLSHMTTKLQEKYLLSNTNKPQITQKKHPRFIKHNSQISKTLPPITSITQNIE
jgi:hypothetical protein